MSEWRMESSKSRWRSKAWTTSQEGIERWTPIGFSNSRIGPIHCIFRRNMIEKAKLLRLMFSNFSVDAVSVSATYRKPFDMIFERARLEEWSGREDSNLRPPGPEPGKRKCQMPDTVSLRDQTAILSQPSFVPKLYRNQFYDLPRLGRAPTWIAAGNSTASFRGGLPFNIATSSDT
jgi:hypothetical protein